MNKLIKTVLAGTIATVSVLPAAQALEAGDMIVRFGAITVAPNADGSDPSLGTINLQDAGLANGISVDDDTQFGFSSTYMFSSHWGLEVLAATPFDHEIKVSGGALDNHKIGSTKHLPPTVSLQYYFMGATNSQWQPYAGLGVNYTNFFDTNVDNNFAATIDTITQDGTTDGDLDIDDPWGMAGQIGLDYYLSENWLVNVSAMYTHINADASIDFNGTSSSQLDVNTDIDPWVYRINVGYKF